MIMLHYQPCTNAICQAHQPVKPVFRLIAQDFQQCGFAVSAAFV
jgi:hypothetical protein